MPSIYVKGLYRPGRSKGLRRADLDEALDQAAEAGVTMRFRFETCGGSCVVRRLTQHLADSFGPLFEIDA